MNMMGFENLTITMAIHVFEEPNVGDQEIPDLEMLSELYAAAEEDG